MMCSASVSRFVVSRESSVARLQKTTRMRIEGKDPVVMYKWDVCY